MPAGFFIQAAAYTDTIDIEAIFFNSKVFTVMAALEDNARGIPILDP